MYFKVVYPSPACLPGCLLVFNASSHCSFVRRRYNPLSGDVSVAGVDEAHGVQTAAGDLLFLKGNAFPGLFGECE